MLGLLIIWKAVSVCYQYAYLFILSTVRCCKLYVLLQFRVRTFTFLCDPEKTYLHILCLQDMEISVEILVIPRRFDKALQVGILDRQTGY